MTSRTINNSLFKTISSSNNDNFHENIYISEFNNYEKKNKLNSSYIEEANELIENEEEPIINFIQNESKDKGINSLKKDNFKKFVKPIIKNSTLSTNEISTNETLKQIHIVKEKPKGNPNTARNIKYADQKENSENKNELKEEIFHVRTLSNCSASEFLKTSINTDKVIYSVPSNPKHMAFNLMLSKKFLTYAHRYKIISSMKLNGNLLKNLISQKKEDLQFEIDDLNQTYGKYIEDSNEDIHLPFKASGTGFQALLFIKDDKEQEFFDQSSNSIDLVISFFNFLLLFIFGIDQIEIEGEFIEFYIEYCSENESNGFINYESIKDENLKGIIKIKFFYYLLKKKYSHSSLSKFLIQKIS